jgi:dUTP pyrophosphatase
MNYGVTVLNSPGTVDSGYRGEIQVILINHSKNNFVIENGDRIAQGVISSVATNNTVNLYKKFTLSESERGDGKFGSTGVK